MSDLDVTPRAATRLGLLAQVVAIVGLAFLLYTIPTGKVVGGGWAPKALYLCRMALLAGLATWFLRMRDLGWADVGLRRPNIGRLVLCVLGGLVVSLAAVVAVQLLVIRLGGPRPDYSRFAGIRGNLGEYLFWAIPVTLGSAALGEELVFRGFLRDALQWLLGPRGGGAVALSILFQGALFGAMHFYQGPGGMATAGTIGLVFGCIWWAAGRNLWAGIVLHAVYDLASMTAIFLAGPPGH